MGGQGVGGGKQLPTYPLNAVETGGHLFSKPIHKISTFSRALPDPVATADGGRTAALATNRYEKKAEIILGHVGEPAGLSFSVIWRTWSICPRTRRNTRGTYC